MPFATIVAGVVVRGRMDAVFADPGGRFDVVDWKTGRRPAGSTARRPRCSSPRTGWPGRSWPGVPVARVRAAFHYVREGATVRPADLLDAAGLAALITGVPLV